MNNHWFDFIPNMDGAKIFLLFLLVLGVGIGFTIWTIWYLIQVAQAPNWAVAIYIFLLICISLRTQGR